MSKVNEADLGAMRLPELQQRYVEVVGEPTRCPNKAWLVRKILEAAMTRSASTPSRPTTTLKTASVDELQARHLEVIGRPTSSRHVGYLRWRLRQAERGRIRIGAEPRAAHGAGMFSCCPSACLRPQSSVSTRLGGGLA